MQKAVEIPAGKEYPWAMLYRPPDGKLWDTLLTMVGEQVHLFHLRKQNGLGHAVSDDWLCWSQRSVIPTAGPAGAWNEGFPPWTGCLVYHENRWRLFLGGEDADGVAGYGWLSSQDLDHWHDDLGRTVLKPDTRWYRRAPSPLGSMHAAWRDPCILRDETGVYHAFLCARRNEWSAQTTGACVAHATSTDLTHWQYHPPIADVGHELLFAEVPDVFRLGEYWYLLLLDHKWGGVGVETTERESPAGTFYLRSRNMTGPYHWPQEPLLIGCDDDQVGPWAARSLQVGEDRWLYFHHNARHSALGVPKRIMQTSNGDLYLERLGLLDKLAKPVDVVESPHATCSLDSGHWEGSGESLCGRAEVVGTTVRLARDLCDVQFACTITPDCRKAGVVLRSTGQPGESFFQQCRHGVSVWLDVQRRRVFVRREVYVPGLGWGRSMGDQMGKRPRHRRGQQVRWDLRTGRPVELHVELRDAFLEVYLNGRWAVSCTLDDHLDAGDIECTVEAGTARFDHIQLQEIPPMSPSSKELAAGTMS